ncbi:cholesterol side-chain cleavage enzyme, mitochondrial-like [Danio aesculapii]|uniref:cholesterol side-chain cleavage enzyme, mitochondrial-like n=1 Tax=Danio aesculapii TaxID=1142201 RepID=UPI0024BFAC9F|nr:cholesterol side-chain cleavage enzyme, mitochondrial-like [Danio aesculapii]
MSRSVLLEELVHQVGACFHFHITTDSGQTSSYYVDLTEGALAVKRECAIARWNVTLARLDQSLSSLKNLLQVKVTHSGRAPQNTTVREKVGIYLYDSVYIIKPEDGAILFKAEGHHRNRINVDAWTAYRDYRNRKYGVLLKEGKAWKFDRMILNKELLLPKVQGTFVPLLDKVGQDFVARVNKQIERSGQYQWTTDLTHELFKFALECPVKRERAFPFKLSRVRVCVGVIMTEDELHPVPMSLPRFITEDTVIQNYHIPAGTLVQLGVYAMGRDHQFFPNPKQYCPTRWINSKRQYFRSLGFGFGPRQCVGRRIAEAEMQIFLINMLENFRFEKQKQIEVGSKFELLLMPEKPIMLTIKPLNGSR